MKFKIDITQITTRELIELEEKQSFAQTNRLMARFMVDEATGEKIPPFDAFEILCDLNVAENQEAQTAFMESFVPNQKSAQR